MAVLQVLQLSAINVVLHPHPDGAYERLLRSAYRRRIAAHIHGDRHGIMSQLNTRSNGGRVVALEGTISTFSKLDPSLPWFNAETSDDASSEDLGTLNVPANLQPNHKKCEFYFDVQSHSFIFDSEPRKGGISARQMLRFLQQVLTHPDVTRTTGIPNLTIIPDQRSVEEVVEWSRIRTLYIEAHRPNPDYDEEDYELFEQSLVEQHAKRLEIRLVAEDNAFLTPSENTQTIAAIAADNGYVEARGEDDQGKKQIRSTKDTKPFSIRDYFDPNAETAWDAFRRMAQEAAASIRRRRRSQVQT